METLVDDFSAGVFTAPRPPCLSLYQPTHRHHPDNRQDPIRFRNLLKRLTESLGRRYEKRDVAALLGAPRRTGMSPVASSRTTAALSTESSTIYRY